MSPATRDGVRRVIEQFTGRPVVDPLGRQVECPVCLGRADADSAADGEWAIHELHHAREVATSTMEALRRERSAAAREKAEAVRLLGAVVEAVGGRVEVPRRLVVDPPDVLLSWNKDDAVDVVVLVTKRPPPTTT